MPEGRLTVDPDGLIHYFSQMSDCWSPYNFHRATKRLERFLKDSQSKCSIIFRGLSRISKRIMPRNGYVNYSDYCPSYSRYVDELLDQLTAFSFDGRWAGLSRFEEEQLLYGRHTEEKLAEILGGFYRKVTRDICVHQNKSFYIEDNTWTLLHLDQYVKIIPEARLLHIHRDPRDVVASYMTQTWMPSDPAKSAQIVADLMAQWWQVSGGLSAENIMELSLYDLVEDSEQVLRTICDYLGLSWSQDLLKIPLNRANRDRWKSEIPKSAHDEVQEILKPVLEHYSYA